MNDSTSFTTSELATIVGGTLDGDGNVRVIGVADVGEAQPNEASFVTNPKYADKVASSRAGVLLVPVDFGRTPMPAIRCQGLERAVASLLGAFAPPVVKPASGIHPTASVHRTATIGPDSAIGPFVQIEADVRIGASVVIHAGCYIGRGTSLGDRCFLWPNVVVRDGCRIGNRVMIHSCSVIGADGFGYYFEEGRHHKVPHIGGVIIEDDVEIGACSCVDRAKFGFTVIGRGTKIDNQVQVAHNVRLGEGCLLAGHAGVAGSTRIGSFSAFGGKAAALDNLTIGQRVRVAGGDTTITHDIPDDMTVSGYPAQENRKQLRERAMIRRLPDLAQQIKDLIARVEQLEAAAHDRP